MGRSLSVRKFVLIIFIMYLVMQPISALASGGDISMINPLDNMIITSNYGYRVHPTLDKVLFHSGLDLGAPSGTPIYSTLSGVVKSAVYSESYGNLLIINTGNIDVYYAHTSKILVAPGDQVKQGEVVALVGSTGRSTGPHLHIEVRIDGVTQNPTNFLNKEFELKDVITSDEFNKEREDKKIELEELKKEKVEEIKEKELDNVDDPVIIDLDPDKDVYEVLMKTNDSELNNSSTKAFIFDELREGVYFTFD